MVHPLAQTWCFCGSTKNRSRKYGDNQATLGEFATVEGFWAIWRSLAKPTKLFHTQYQLEAARGGNPGREPQTRVEALCLFKKGISPQWEDPANAAGGQFNWQPRVDLQSGETQELDVGWEELVLAMVGGLAFGGCEHICGLRVVDKSKRAWSGRSGPNKLPRWTPATCSYRFEMWFDHEAVIQDDLRQQIADDLQSTLQPLQSTLELPLDFTLKMHSVSLSHAEIKAAEFAAKQREQREQKQQKDKVKTLKVRHTARTMPIG